LNTTWNWRVTAAAGSSALACSCCVLAGGAAGQVEALSGSDFGGAQSVDVAAVRGHRLARQLHDVGPADVVRMGHVEGA
jgi:hypothetical protein